MKRVLIALMLSGCGVEMESSIPGPQGEPGIQGERGEQGEPGENAVVPKETSFEGYFLLPNGGYLDIYEDAQGLSTVRTARLVVVNKDGSTGVVPIASAASLPTVSERLFHTANVNFTAPNNVKQDSGVALVGSFLTQLVFFYRNDKLLVQVKVSGPVGLLVNQELEAL